MAPPPVRFPVIAPVAAAPKQPFKGLLPPGLTAKATKPTTSSAPCAPGVVATLPQATTRPTDTAHAHRGADQLAAVRSQHHATAQAQVTARAEVVETREQRLTSRGVDLIVKELIAEFEAQPMPRVANPLQPMADLPFPVPAGPPPTAEMRAHQAVALIERIDTFVRSQRPALALTLNNSLGARVEIEKLGPGRIALRLVGQRGPPSVDTVNRIRDELQARGLTVGALSVA